MGQSEASGRHRYTASIALEIEADGLDIAWRIAKQAARNAGLVEGITRATPPLLDLRYVPPVPVDAEPDRTPSRGRTISP